MMRMGFQYNDVMDMEEDEIMLWLDAHESLNGTKTKGYKVKKR